MVDTDEYYKKIERWLTGELKSTGKVENSFWQHVGKIYNHDFNYNGKMYDDMLGNVERVMSGKHKHGYQQNKKTDTEKLIEKGRSEQ